MSLFKNSAIVIVGVLISNVLAYAFHFIAGRMLGPDKYGEFGSLMALFMLVAIPSSAISGSIAKFTSQFYVESDHSKIAALRWRMQRDIVLFSSAIILVFLVFSSPIARYLKIDSTIPVILIGILLLFSFLLTLHLAILQGLKKFKAISKTGIFEALTRLLLLLLFLYFGGGVSASILAYGLAYFLAFLFVFPIIKDFYKVKPDENQLDIKSIYRFGLQVLLVNLIIQGLTNLPSLFIKHYYSNEFCGYWTAALNIARISQFVTGSITMVMFPEIVAEKNPVHRKKTFRKAVFLVLLSSLAVTVLLFIFPQFMLQCLYGKQYLDAANLLGWMGLAMVFIGFLQLWLNYKLAKSA